MILGGVHHGGDLCMFYVHTCTYIRSIVFYNDSISWNQSTLGTTHNLLTQRLVPMEEYSVQIVINACIAASQPSQSVRCVLSY